MFVHKFKFVISAKSVNYMAFLDYLTDWDDLKHSQVLKV